jgi:hypothetical protein
MKSDLSGERLEGTREPTPIKVTFADGSQRQATVTFEEAERLRANSVPPERKGRLAQSSGWVVRNGWKLFAAVVAAWFASIVIPALVLQWADRQKELELKNALVTGISTSVGDTLEGASLVELGITPEANAVASKRRNWRAEQNNAKNPKGPNGIKTTKEEQAAIDKARDAWSTASEARRRADQKLTNETHKTWIKSGASIEARLATYFPREAVTDRWRDYHTVVLDFLTLATRKGKVEWDAEKSVLAYVCQDPEIEPPLRKYPTQAGPGSICPEGKDTIANVLIAEGFPFRWAFHELLRKRVALLTEIREANAEGYSSTRRDFLDDISLGLNGQVANLGFSPMEWR